MDQFSLATLAEDLIIDAPLVTHGTEALHLGTRTQSRDTKSKRAPILGLAATVATGVDRGHLAGKGDNRGLSGELGHLEEVIKKSEE